MSLASISRDRVPVVGLTVCSQHPRTLAQRAATWRVSYTAQGLDGPEPRHLYSCDLCVASAMRWAIARHVGEGLPSVSPIPLPTDSEAVA